MYVLGIDGGGTRTTGIVADEHGNVHMHAVTGRSNPNTLQQAEFEEVICGLVKELKRQNNAIFTQVSVCFAGIAGVGESGRDVEVAALLARELPAGTKVIVRNDAFNALYSGTLGGPGIVQIAGTGAVTLGINENGEVARSGGWGYLFDDEGSGFYLGNEALKAVFRFYDDRGPATSLTGEDDGLFRSCTSSRYHRQSVWTGASSFNHRTALTFRRAGGASRRHRFNRNH